MAFFFIIHECGYLITYFYNAVRHFAFMYNKVSACLYGICDHDLYTAVTERALIPDLAPLSP
jgi:hypothetical protein